MWLFAKHPTQGNFMYKVRNDFLHPSSCVECLWIYSKYVTYFSWHNNKTCVGNAEFSLLHAVHTCNSTNEGRRFFSAIHSCLALLYIHLRDLFSSCSETWNEWQWPTLDLVWLAWQMQAPTLMAVSSLFALWRYSTLCMIQGLTACGL